MAKKFCTIEIILNDYHRFVASPNWQSPLDSPVAKERNNAFFFESKRDAKLFARLLRTHQKKTCFYKFKIDIDDLPF